MDVEAIVFNCIVQTDWARDAMLHARSRRPPTLGFVLHERFVDETMRNAYATRKSDLVNGCGPNQASERTNAKVFELLASLAFLEPARREPKETVRLDKFFSFMVLNRDILGRSTRQSRVSQKSDARPAARKNHAEN